MPSRKIVLDTETTGLNADGGDRIIEIAAIELIDDVPTGMQFHAYLSPEGRKSHPEALAVHNIPDEFLVDKPVFSSIGQRLRDFLENSVVVAHFAKFDVKMLLSEWKRMGITAEPEFDVLCSKKYAMRTYPGLKRYSLDALCTHFGIDLSSRANGHGAMIDTQLLCRLYSALSASDDGGKHQTDLTVGAANAVL